MRILILTFILFLGVNAWAQENKSGHINLQEVLKAMPELKTAQDQINTIKSGLQKKSEQLSVEYNGKLTAFQELEKKEKRSDALRNADVEELNSIKARKDKFDTESNASLQADIDKLIQPVIDKANKAIADVANEKGLVYVFEASNLLFYSKKSADILPEVRAKLGIK